MDGMILFMWLEEAMLRKYIFRHAKGKSMVNFFIVNVLGQNLANSESCPILRL